MRTLRIRLNGRPDAVSAVINELHGMNGVDRVEEVADQSAHMRDDSSSLGLVDDVDGTDFHDVEVHAGSAAAADRAYGAIERASRALGVAVEFVDRF